MIKMIKFLRPGPDQMSHSWRKNYERSNKVWYHFVGSTHKVNLFYNGRKIIENYFCWSRSFFPFSEWSCYSSYHEFSSEWRMK